MRLEDINETMFQALSPEVQVAIVNQPDYIGLIIISVLIFTVLLSMLV